MADNNSVDFNSRESYPTLLKAFDILKRFPYGAQNDREQEEVDSALAVGWQVEEMNPVEDNAVPSETKTAAPPDEEDSVGQDDNVGPSNTTTTTTAGLTNNRNDLLDPNIKRLLSLIVHQIQYLEAAWPSREKHNVQVGQQWKEVNKDPIPMTEDDFRVHCLDMTDLKQLRRHAQRLSQWIEKSGDAGDGLEDQLRWSLVLGGIIEMRELEESPKRKAAKATSATVDQSESDFALSDPEKADSFGTSEIGSEGDDMYGGMADGDDDEDDKVGREGESEAGGTEGGGVAAPGSAENVNTDKAGEYREGSDEGDQGDMESNGDGDFDGGVAINSEEVSDVDDADHAAQAGDNEVKEDTAVGFSKLNL